MIPRPLPLEKGGPLEAPLGHEAAIKVVSVEVVITASIEAPPAWTMLKSSSFVLALFQLRVLEADDVVVEKVGIAEAAVEAASGVASLGGAVIGTLLRGFLRAVLSEVLDSLSNLDHEGRSAGMIMTIV